MVRTIIPQPEDLPADYVLSKRPSLEKWNECVTKLLAFLSLEDDWNSEGAAAVLPVNVYAAIALLQMIRESGMADTPPQPLPGVDGEVLLVWRFDRQAGHPLTRAQK